MRINNNMMAMNTHRQLGINTDMGQKSIEKLSSGFRINRAGDDAAGLAISEKMRGQIRGLNQASRNAQDGISLIQTAEGALTETHAILQRMRELAVQSSTDTNTDADRAEIQKEIDQLATEITRIADTTEFNTMDLLKGEYKDKKFHIGANQDQNTTIAIEDMRADALGVKGEAYTDTVGQFKVTTRDNTLNVAIEKADVSGGTGVVSSELKDGVATVKMAFSGSTIKASVGEVENALKELGLTVEATVSGKTVATSGAKTQIKTLNSGASKELGINVSNQDAANTAITTIDGALGKVSSERSKLGAMQNRLEHTIKNLDNTSENLQAAESRIRDVDMAKEMMEFTKQNILQQAATAMLAQSNQLPGTVLQLLR